MRHKSMKIGSLQAIHKYLKYAGFDMDKTDVIGAHGRNVDPHIFIVTHDNKLWSSHLHYGLKGNHSDDKIFLERVIMAYSKQFNEDPKEVCKSIGKDPGEISYYWRESND